MATKRKKSTAPGGAPKSAAKNAAAKKSGGSSRKAAPKGVAAKKAPPTKKRTSTSTKAAPKGVAARKATPKEPARRIAAAALPAPGNITALEGVPLGALADVQTPQIRAIVLLLKNDRDQNKPPRTADSIADELGIPIIRVQLFLGLLVDDDLGSRVTKLDATPPTYRYD